MGFSYDRPFKPLGMIPPTLAGFSLPPMVAQLQSERAYLEHGVGALTLLRTEALTIVLTIVRAGHTLGDRHVPTAGALFVLEGQVTLVPREGREPKELDSGALVVLGEAVVHAVEARRDSALVTILGNQPGVRDGPRLHSGELPVAMRSEHPAGAADYVDEASMESFPASDSPSFTPGRSG